MDELFFLPPVPVAMPRAYWLGFDKFKLSAQILVIKPSTFEYNRIFKAIAAARSDEFDMDILNKLYNDSALVLPHRGYGMITSTLYGDDHSNYLGNTEEKWDVDMAMKEAKLIHFSDWPIPKVSIALNWLNCCKGETAGIRNSTTPCSGFILMHHFVK